MKTVYGVYGSYMDNIPSDMNISCPFNVNVLRGIKQLSNFIGNVSKKKEGKQKIQTLSAMPALSI